MRDYYEHTRNIFRVTERITEQFASGYAPPERARFLAFCRCAEDPRRGLESFFMRNGQLYPDRRGLFQNDPEE